MRLRLRLFVIFILLLALMMMSTATVVNAQVETYCSNGATTTLQSAGVPNLYRLGLQRGVSWQSIAAASGVSDVTRVLPNQLLCVPNSSSAATTTTVYTTDPTTTTANMDMVEEEQPTQNFITPGGYCDALFPGGIPVDRGSCLLELQSIQSGVQSIVETGITCSPRVIVGDIDGNLRQCSVRGDILLTLPFITALVGTPVVSP